MITRIALAAGIGAVVVMTAGCAGKIRYPHYYLLELPPAPAAAKAGPPLPSTIAVRRFSTPSYLRGGRIVYREGPAEVEFYEYHRWAEDPASAVTAAVMESLRSAHVFASVKQYDGQGQQDYILTGRLDRLEEVDSPGEVRVEARVSAELIDLRTGAVVWTGDGHEIVPVESRSVNSVVMEMSHAVRKSIDQMVGSLDQQSVLPARASR